MRRPGGVIELETCSPEETRRLGAALTPVLRPGDVLALSGDLGAGKTTFVQGVAAGLGIPGRVTSPTFVLIREYAGGRFPLLHLDVYRLESAQDVIDLGIDELLDPSSIAVIEWGDLVEPLLPREVIRIELRRGGDETRHITIGARGDRCESIIPTIHVLVSELFSPGREQG